METYSSMSSRKGRVPQRKYPMTLQVGTKKTCKLRYNMTKAHSKLYVWSESPLVDVKTPEIEQGEGGEPGILVMQVSANSQPAEDTAFVFVSDKMKPDISYYCDALEFNLTTTGPDGALPPAQETSQPPQSALGATPPPAPAEGDNLLKTQMLAPSETSMPVTPASHTHRHEAAASGTERTAQDVQTAVLDALGMSSTGCVGCEALSERVLALEKTTHAQLTAAREATEAAQKLALETIEAGAKKDDADVKDANESRGVPVPKLDFAGVAKLKVDMTHKVEEAREALKPLQERIAEEGYAWDWCVVFPEDEANPGHLTREGQLIVEKLDKEAFEVLCFRGITQPEPTPEELAADPKKKMPKNPKPGKGKIYCLLRLPLNNLREIADSLNYSMELDPDELKKRMLEGFVVADENGEEQPFTRESLLQRLEQDKKAKYVYPRIYLEHDKEDYDEKNVMIKSIEAIHDVDVVERTTEQQADLQSLRVLLHAPYITGWEPFCYIYGQYEGEVDEAIYHRSGNLPHPFDDVARMNIQHAFIGTLKFLAGEPLKGGKICKGLGMKKCQEKKFVLDIYPLHNRVERNELKARWYKSFAYPFRNRRIVPPAWRIHQEPENGRRQPDFDAEGKPMVTYEMDELVRKYFGEKVCLYMAFQTHYSSWLQIGAFLGMAHSFELIGAGQTCRREGPADDETTCTPFVSPGLFAFAIVMNIWAVLMMEYWKRTENVLAVRWGTTSFEEEEVDRPEFVGEDLWDWESTGRKRRYFADDNKTSGVDPEVYQQGWVKGSGAKSSRLMFSKMVNLSFVLTVIGAVFSCFYIRMVLVSTNWAGIGETYGKLIGSMLNAGQITVMEVLYEGCAKWLNSRENHRTDTEFEDALISKIFRFTFVNSYSALFYQVFLSSAIDRGVESLECKGVECIQLLVASLFIVMLTKMGTFGKPFKFTALKAMFRKVDNARELKASDPELEGQWAEYDMIWNSIKDYNEIAQQFGYAMLFVVAAPWAPIVAWIGMILKTRIDSHKMIFDCRRPIPKKASDIGNWQGIFQTMTGISIVVNSCLICFVLDGSGASTEAGKVWVFNAIQYVLFILMLVTQVLVEDEPFKMKVQLARQDTIVDTYIKKVADEDDEPMEDDDEPMVIHENWLRAPEGLVRRTVPKKELLAEAAERDGEGEDGEEGEPLKEGESGEGTGDPGETKAE